MSNIITVTFDNTTVITAAPAYQHDYGQMLKIEGVDLPSTFEVHFCNEGDTVTTTQVGNEGIVTVPDAYFLNGKNIWAFIYLHSSANDGETAYKVVIPVRKRQQPTHDTPTPVQQSELEQAIAALNTAVTQTGIDAASASASASDAYRDAERAEQAAANAGFMDVEIVDGNLVYTRTDAVDVDFELSDGHLIMEVV